MEHFAGIFIPVPAIIFAALYVGYSVWADGQGRGGINHSAHLVGAIFGMLATILVEPAIVPHFFNALMHPLFGYGRLIFLRKSV